MTRADALGAVEWLVDVLDVELTDWQADALCAQTDPAVFFPEKGQSTRAAVEICGRCPVKEQCLAHAIDNREPHGIWGGMAPRRRRKLHAKLERPAVERLPDAEIDALIDSGAPTVEIAAASGVSCRTVERRRARRRAAATDEHGSNPLAVPDRPT